MEKIKQFLMAGGSTSLEQPETVLRCFNDLFSRQCLNSAGLAVGTTTTKFKIANTTYALVNGVLVGVLTADGPVLTGYNLTATQTGGFVVTVDAAGTIYALPIQPATFVSTSPALVVAPPLPVVPPSQVAIGVVLINSVNATAATYTGGTTLMSATNVAYVNLVGPFNPTSAF